LTDCLIFQTIKINLHDLHISTLTVLTIIVVL
jgi:hypothetical protein